MAGELDKTGMKVPGAGFEALATEGVQKKEPLISAIGRQITQLKEKFDKLVDHFEAGRWSSTARKTSEQECRRLREDIVEVKTASVNLDKVITKNKLNDLGTHTRDLRARQYIQTKVSSMLTQLGDKKGKEIDAIRAELKKLEFSNDKEIERDNKVINKFSDFEKKLIEERTKERKGLKGKISITPEQYKSVHRHIEKKAAEIEKKATEDAAISSAGTLFKKEEAELTRKEERQKNLRETRATAVSVSGIARVSKTVGQMAATKRAELAMPHLEKMFEATGTAPLSTVINKSLHGDNPHDRFLDLKSKANLSNIKVEGRGGISQADARSAILKVMGIPAYTQWPTAGSDREKFFLGQIKFQAEKNIKDDFWNQLIVRAGIK